MASAIRRGKLCILYRTKKIRKTSGKLSVATLTSFRRVAARLKEANEWKGGQENASATPEIDRWVVGLPTA